MEAEGLCAHPVRGLGIGQHCAVDGLSTTAKRVNTVVGWGYFSHLARRRGRREGEERMTVAAEW